MVRIIRDLNNSGMSLIEITVSMGILTLIALSSAYITQGFTKSQINAERNADVVQRGINIRDSLKAKAGSDACTDIISIDSGEFSVTNEDEITVVTNGTEYSSGTQINTNYRFDRIYFGNKILIGSTPVHSTYTTTMYVNPAILQNGIWMPQARKSLGSISVQVDSTTGEMLDCNLSAMAVNSEAVCESVSGMIWVPSSSECIMNLETEADGTVVECAGGFYKTANGDCVPEKTDCTYMQRLPRQVAHGNLQPSCDDLPPQYVVNHDPAYTYVKPHPSADYNTQPNPYVTPSVTPTPSPAPAPKACSCGQYEVPSGGHCAKAREVGNVIGGSPDWHGDCEVYVFFCTDGNMPQVKKYYEEESDMCDSSYDKNLHRAQCNQYHTGCTW